MHALVIQHIKFEHLSAWDAPLRAAGFEIEELEAGVDSFDRDPLEPDLLIVLGGPISVYETDIYPFLNEEIAFVRRRLEAGAAMIGVCLGAQLIAAASGARVYSGAREYGFAPIALTDAGRMSCLAAFADDPATLHWHGDTFDLPPGAALLASTDLVRNQAFAVGPKVLGVQFHPEWGGEPLEPWLIGHTVELNKASVAIPALRAAAERLRPRMAIAARRVLTAYLAGAGLA
jgi:GMP synthase (glutamine-hydrolysing)